MTVPSELMCPLVQWCFPHPLQVAYIAYPQRFSFALLLWLDHQLEEIFSCLFVFHLSSIVSQPKVGSRNIVVLEKDEVTPSKEENPVNRYQWLFNYSFHPVDDIEKPSMKQTFHIFWHASCNCVPNHQGFLQRENSKHRNTTMSIYPFRQLA